MIGSRDSNRSEGQGGRREALSAKEVCSKDTTVGTRTDSEAVVRAMSVPANAKSNSLRKTHWVESDGTGRKFMHLTRGGLWGESLAGVSRGHSSLDARRKPGRAKGRRTSRRRSTDRLRGQKRIVIRNKTGRKPSGETGRGEQRGRKWILDGKRLMDGKQCPTRKEAQEDA